MGKKNRITARSLLFNIAVKYYHERKLETRIYDTEEIEMYKKANFSAPRLKVLMIEIVYTIASYCSFNAEGV